MTHDDPPHPRLIAATVHGRYLVRPPAAGVSDRWLIGFHGYAQTAEIMLDLLRPVPGAERWLVVAVQALHPFYNRANEIVANWMTRQDREQAIADNLAYVDAVVAELEREFGVPRSLVSAGFSQGVAMAYRAGVLGRRPADAVLAVAGDVPPELKRSPPRRWPRVRIVVGTRETYYSLDKMRADLDALRAAGVDATAVTFEGGHEWTPGVIAAAGALLAEVEALPRP